MLKINPARMIIMMITVKTMIQIRIIVIMIATTVVVILKVSRQGTLMRKRRDERECLVVDWGRY